MYCFLFLKALVNWALLFFSYMKTGHVEKKSSKIQQTPKFSSKLFLPPTHRTSVTPHCISHFLLGPLSWGSFILFPHFSNSLLSLYPSSESGSVPHVCCHDALNCCFWLTSLSRVKGQGLYCALNLVQPLPLSKPYLLLSGCSYF